MTALWLPPEAPLWDLRWQRHRGTSTDRNSRYNLKGHRFSEVSRREGSREMLLEMVGRAGLPLSAEAGVCLRGNGSLRCKHCKGFSRRGGGELGH